MTLSGLSSESKPKLVFNQKTSLLTGDSVTLKCELGVRSGLVFHWYRDTQTSDPVAQTGGDSYSIHSVRVSDGGQYWCRAGRGDPVYYTQYSNEMLLTVTDGDVILDSPVRPVIEGRRLSLLCMYRNTSSVNITYFYRDGSLLHTSSTGAMTIPAVSKSHEGLYKCGNPEKGESPGSWITVRGRCGSTIFTKFICS
ncbi:hypothetical protein ACEWY4_024949 [Coilia grayii]|uniref:Ig-like domain-containing protein n=1 Tax=Coilia grayii TaxID=363190 RepID=A0ABD1IW57_9TELE